MTLQTMNRIQWVDIYKGLVIIFMVIGHTTDNFNIFIYQFHMAAFFFISGYTANINRKTISEIVLNKFFTFLLPLFTVFFIILGMLIALDKLNFYNYLLSDPLQAVNIIIRTFFYTGDNYILWMGATWFIITLFGIVILHKILFTLSGSNINLIYIVFSISLFLYGYHLTNIDNVPQWSIFDFDIICVGQFYYFIGVLVKKINLFERLEELNWRKYFLFIISIFLLWYFGKINPITVDYPSRHFGNPFDDAFVAINGIISCYFLARITEKLPQKCINTITYAGRNTLGILFFHFMFFKAGFYILYLAKIVPLTYLQTFVPIDEIGSSYWPFIAGLSIILSLITWKLISMIPGLRFLLGQNKDYYEFLWNKLCQFRFVSRFAEIKQIVRDQIRQVLWNYKNNAIISIKKNKTLSFLIFLFIALACIPLIQPSIMCNDELQSRFWGLQGAKQFLDHMIGEHISKGRALSAYFVSSTMYMGFIGVKEGLFRVIPTITICIDVFLFGYLIFKIFTEKYFSVFVSVCILAFLPISFEHTAPNAFTALYNIPFMILLVSLILYVEYLNNGKKGVLIVSLVLFFFSMTAYEIFITYAPLYFILAWHKTPRDKRYMKEILRKWALPLAVSLLFLAFYIIFRKIYPSDYEGNQIGGFTIVSALAIISQLFTASFPGYFLFNKKYLFLLSTFWENKSIWQIVSLRLVSIIIVLAVISWTIFKQSKSDRSESRQYHPLAALGAGLCFVILPTFPLSVSKMYQGIVNSNDFIALPTTFFTYFSAMFVVCYLMWLIIKRIQNKKILAVFATAIAMYCLPVQAMNESMLEKQVEYYERLTTIEELFETETMKELNNQTIFSEDLYKTNYSLFIHDGYWTQYAKSKGLNLNIIQNDRSPAVTLYYPSDEYFTLATSHDMVLLSKSNLEGKIIPVKIGNTGVYLEKTMPRGVYDRGFYIYKYVINNENEIEVQDANYIPFRDIVKTVGNTLDSCKILGGYYEDGWVTDISSFKIASGPEGEIVIMGYYPNKPTNKENILVYINGNEITSYTIDQNSFEFEVPCEVEKELTIEIKTNFSQMASQTDKREVSFILLNLEGR